MKPAPWLAIACILLSACHRDKDRATLAAPPATRAARLTETIHGVPVADNYRWLETDSAEVLQWTDAQNAYTRDVLDRLPGRSALEARLRALARVGDLSAPVVRGNRYFYASRAGGDERTVVYWRNGAFGADTRALDPAEIDSSGGTDIAWFSPSFDGHLLAYGAVRSGATPVLRVVDLDRRVPVDTEIPDAPAGIQWLPDGSGFLYEHLVPAKGNTGGEGRWHRLGTPVSADALIYRPGPSATLSRDGKWLTLAYATTPAANDLWLVNFDEFRRTGRMSAEAVSVRNNARALGTVTGDTLFVYTTKGAPHGRVVAAPARTPGESHWRTVVPERADADIVRVDFGRDTILVTSGRNAVTAIDLFAHDGRPKGSLRQPGLGVSTVAASTDRTEAFLTFTSFNTPMSLYRVDLATPQAEPRPWLTADAPFDPSTCDVEQVWFPSKDGTRISMFLAHRRGLARASSTPVLLAGYGALGVRMMPTFSPAAVQWFEAGGLLAVPNLRGGGEYGEAWHQAAVGPNKHVAIDDLIAAGEWLVTSGTTSPSKLGVYGESHGALVAASALAARPDLFRAGVLVTPLADMARYERFGGEAWTAEYGSAAVPDLFNALIAYSPYHRIKPATKYPAVLVIGVEAAGRVHPMHARKLAAALRAATSSDPATAPILLRMDRPAGLSPEALEDLQFRDLVDQRLFLLWQLGMTR